MFDGLNLPVTQVEIDVTLRCDGPCLNCNRGASRNGPFHFYLKGRPDLSLDDAARLTGHLKTWQAAHRPLKEIHLIGGDPFAHPDLAGLARIFRELKNETTNVLIVSAFKYNFTLEGLSVVNFIPMAEKSGCHRCSYVAPCDTGQEIVLCPLPGRCGPAYDNALVGHGFFPCGHAAQICDIFNLPQYCLAELPADYSGYPPLRDLCRYCQAGTAAPYHERHYGALLSPSYKRRLETLKKELEHG